MFAAPPIGNDQGMPLVGLPVVRRDRLDGAECVLSLISLPVVGERIPEFEVVMGYPAPKIPGPVSREAEMWGGSCFCNQRALILQPLIAMGRRLGGDGAGFVFCNQFCNQ